MQHRTMRYRWIWFFIILLLALGVTVPVLADYLGPNRTVTTTVSVCKVVLKSCMYIESKGEYRYHTTDSWSCSNESKPWQSYPSNGGACPPGRDHWERDESVEEITVTYDPATIVGTVQDCTLSNGWCGVTAPELSLSAAEPLAGYSITLIEGTLNGTSFACQSGETSCTIPMIEGDNTFNYWALSSWGDSSLIGTTTVKVDTIPPEVTLNVTGTAGNQGWYKSPIQVAANALDATSGVATFEVSVDGGGYQAYTTQISFTNDARHTLQFRTMDNAGNLFESPVQNFFVDTIPPTVNVPGSWQLGRNVPYDVVDEGSGLGALRIVIEDEDEKYAKVAWDEDHVSGRSYSQDIDWNGQFKDKTVAPPGTYLVWLKARDVAGNEHFELGKVIVPEPNYVGAVVLPTEEPAASIIPPMELSQPEETTSLPRSPEGTKPTTTTHSFTLTSGTAGGMTSSSAATTSSSVLWGAAAAAAIGAATTYALEATRKRKEAEEAQAAAVRAEVARSKAERAEKQQKQKENYEKQQALQQAIDAYHEQKARDAYNARMEEKLTKLEEKENAAWLAGQAAIKTKQAEKKKTEAAAAKLAGLPGFNAEKQGAPKVLPAPVPGDEPPWWEKVKQKVEQAKQWTQDHVIQPAKDAVNKTVTTVQKTVEQVKNTVKETATKVVTTVQTKVEEARKAVKQNLEDAKQWVKTKVEETKQKVEDAKKTMQTFVATTVTTAQKKYEEVKTTVKQKLDNAKQWVQTKYEETKKVVKQKVEETKQWVDTRVIQPTIAYIKDTPRATAVGIDALLDLIYDYHGPATPPSGVNGTLLLALPGVTASTPRDYIFKNYYVNQVPGGNWPSLNECVTAATIQEMNMMQDILAVKYGIPQIPHADLPSFAAMYDSYGVLNWLHRPPADVPVIGGMLPPGDAEKVLNRHGELLRENYGCGYTAELTSGNTVNDLIENLQNGYPTSIHISQPTSLFKIVNGKVTYGDWRALIGDAPHTVTLAGYDSNTDRWLILDPSPYANTRYTEWSTQQLMDLWGRQFLGYPPRFAMTTLIPDASCTLPPTTPTGTTTTSPTAQPSSTITSSTPATSGTPATPSPTTTGTVAPSQTVQSASTGTSTAPSP